MNSVSVNKPSHRRWFILAASLAVVFIITGPRMAYSVFIEPLMAEFGWSRTVVVFPYALFNLLQGLIQPVVGRLLDFYGPRRIILISVIIGSLAFIAISGITQLWHMIFLFSIIFSIAVAGSGPIPSMVLLAPWFSEQQRAKVFAAILAIMPASIFIFAPVAFFVVTGWGWRYGFAVLGIVILVNIPLVLAGLRARNPATPNARDGTWDDFLPAILRDSKDAFRRRPFLYLSLAYFVCGFTAIFLIGQIVVIATAYGFTPRIGVTAAVLIGISSSIGTIICGVLADRYPRTIVLSITYVTRALGFILLATIAANGPFIFYGTVILIGLALFGTSPSTNALVYGIFRGKGAGMVMGLIFLLHQVGGFLGMLLGGIIFDLAADYTLMFWLGSVLLIFAAIISFRAGKLLEQTGPRPGITS